MGVVRNMVHFFDCSTAGGGIMDWIGCWSECAWSSWSGLDWVSKLLDWVGLDLAKCSTLECIYDKNTE